MTPPREPSGPALEPLAAFVAAEQARPVSAAAAAGAEAIRRRWGRAVRAAVFYGSCLRSAESDAPLGDRIHDFYAVVDDYRKTEASTGAALAARLLPPTVRAVSARTPGGELRCKVAVISVADFERGVRARIRPHLWARFAQPTRVVYAREPAARDWLAEQAAAAIRTAVARGLALQAGPAGTPVPFECSAFWRATLCETVASEWRTEAAASVETWLGHDPAWFVSIWRRALDELEDSGQIRSLRTEIPPTGELAASVELLDPVAGARWGSAPRRWLSRGITAAALVKGALTYADWRTYAAGKLSRARAERRPDRPGYSRDDPTAPGPSS